MVDDKASMLEDIVMKLVKGEALTANEAKSMPAERLEELKKEIDEAREAGDSVEIPF